MAIVINMYCYFDEPIGVQERWSTPVHNVCPTWCVSAMISSLALHCSRPLFSRRAITLARQNSPKLLFGRTSHRLPSKQFWESAVWLMTGLEKWEYLEVPFSNFRNHSPITHLEGARRTIDHSPEYFISQALIAACKTTIWLYNCGGWNPEQSLRAAPWLLWCDMTDSKLFSQFCMRVGCFSHRVGGVCSSVCANPSDYSAFRLPQLYLTTKVELISTFM